MPSQCEPSADAEQVLGVAASGQRGVEIVSGGGGERVDRGRVTAHRRGKDSRHNQPGESGGELGDDEGRIDRVTAHPRLVCPGEPQARPDQKKESDLTDDENA